MEQLAQLELSDRVRADSRFPWMVARRIAPGRCPPRLGGPRDNRDASQALAFSGASAVGHSRLSTRASASLGTAMPESTRGLNSLWQSISEAYALGLSFHPAGPAARKTGLAQPHESPKNPWSFVPTITSCWGKRSPDVNLRLLAFSQRLIEVTKLISTLRLLIDIQTPSGQNYPAITSSDLSIVGV